MHRVASVIPAPLPPEPEPAAPELSTNEPSMLTTVGNRMVRQGFVAARRGKRGGQRFPPTIRAELKGTHVFRYVGTVAQESDITVGSLARTVVAGNSSTSARPVFTSVRLRRISIWTPVQAIGSAPTFCALRFEGVNTDDTTHYDTSAVVDDMAHVSRVPPKMSVAGFWHHLDSADLSLKLAWVSLGADSIMDIEVEYVMDDTAVSGSYTFTGGVGLTNGVLYYGGIGAYTQPGKVQF